MDSIDPIEKWAITVLMKPMTRIYQNIKFAAKAIQGKPGNCVKVLGTA